MARDDGLLPGMAAPPVHRGGAVYQGVCASIRTLVELGVVDKERQAGTIAQARSLAASVDRESGSDPRHRQASGVSLAALHERLDALMARLDPEDAAADGPDAFDKLMEEFSNPPTTADRP